MHRQTVTSKHFDSRNPLLFEQRHFHVQTTSACGLGQPYQLAAWQLSIRQARPKRGLVWEGIADSACFVAFAAMPVLWATGC
jgi:hypothetical protein